MLTKIITKVLIVMTIAIPLTQSLGNNKKYPQLSTFEQKMQAGERLNIVYLGGSITWGACASDQGKTSYRALVSEFFEKQYPKAHLKFVDAAIGGTPSKLGVFRMDRDVLPYNPDLTFIEFAVNDGGKTKDSVETMEGIIRKLKKSNPDMAIFIIVIGAGKKNKYATPRHQEHINLAKYYGLPYADVCGSVKKGIKDKTIDTNMILADGCHPNDTGYKLYADIIIDNIKKSITARGKVKPYPKAMTKNRYETAKMLELSKLKDLGRWKKGKVATLGTWYDQQPSRWISSVIVPKNDAAEMSFELECAGIGIYYETFKKGESIIIDVDDKQVYNIPTTMKLHYNRLGWKFNKLYNKNKKRKVVLKAPKKNVKAAYILYTQ